MIKNNKYVWIVVVAIVILILSAFYAGKKSAVAPTDTITSTTTEGELTTEGTTTTKNPIKTGEATTINNTSPAGYYSYANAEYNFSMKYPKTAQLRNGFSTFHQIGNNWRLYPGQANQGKPVVSFSLHNIDQGTYSTGKQSYPLYFSAEVRVGVSPNTKECYATDAGYTSQKVTNVSIGGVTWKRFSTSDAAMMKYVQAESYRTIHNNMCYVVEQIKAGSSYRDDLMKPGVSETTLNNYYNAGKTIVDTFRFTK